MNLIVSKVCGLSEMQGLPGRDQLFLTPTMRRGLEQLKARFIEERTKGFTDPSTGQTHSPVSPEEAQQRWAKIEAQFTTALQTADAASVRKLGISPWKLNDRPDRTEQVPARGFGAGGPVESAFTKVCGVQV